MDSLDFCTNYKIANSLDDHELSHQDNFEVLPEDSSAHNIATDENSEPEHGNYIEVDYLDLGDLIEHEIQELTTEAQIDGVADVAYQTHLVVNLDNAVIQDKTAKEIANLIITEIEEMSKKFGDTVGQFYYFCCQSIEAKSENYKDSNRKWWIRYDFINAIEVNIFHGSLHPRSDLCIELPDELQEEIKAHSHLTAIELKNHFQKLFQRYDNHIESACKLLSEYECHSFQHCLEIKDSDATAIGFIMPLLEKIKNFNISINEIYFDATYKTARGRYELYGTIADVEGTGFPIAYLILDTTKVSNTSTSTGKRRKIIELFLATIKTRNINPDFVFTDKDFAEINAATNVWGHSCETQLHITYDINQAMNEFDFINPAFYPTEDDCDPKKYIVCLSTCQSIVLVLMQKHFDMHPLIPVDAQGNTLTSTNIRQNAIVTGVITPWWWDDFKKAWNTADTKDQNININVKGKRKRSINKKTTDSKSSYFTDINCWVCSCPAFLGNNFIRRTTPPFLVLKDYESDRVTPDTSSIVPFEMETNINNMSYSIDIDEDLEEEARFYVESN
ncbi:11060_t:CDS:2 [Scutellospora calospora]|uniref:11060_t:CDS:1 n=1 Tax=Scutellospora calospora TaxID=85575 RepID=A0ACA9KXJ4_9GLOM|nr:11060_t:CDS:2 [Scutellospora calospora]